MTRYFFEISYNGKKYHGWQRQANSVSVQETIESCLSKLYSNKDIGIIGCGRTDAGVHAKQYFFHVDLENSEDPLVFVLKLNRMLPENIFIKEMKSVESDLHARFSAKKEDVPLLFTSSKRSF